MAFGFSEERRCAAGLLPPPRVSMKNASAFFMETRPSPTGEGAFRCPFSYRFLRKQQEDPNKGQGQVRAISRLYSLPRGGGPRWGQGIKLFRHSNTFIKDISSPPGYSTPPFFRGDVLYIPAPILDWFCCNRVIPSQLPC